MVSFYPHRMMEWLKLIMLHIFDLFRLHDLIYVEPSSPRLWGSMGICSPKAKRHMSSVRRATSSTAVLPAVWQVWAAGMGSVGSWQATSFRTIFQQMQGITIWYVPFPSRVANSRPNARNTPIDVTPMFADFWPSCPVQNNDPLDAAGAFHMPKPRAHADASCDWTRQHLLQKTSRTASKLEVSRGLSMSPWCHVALLLPGVLQKAVAEVSKIRNLKEMWIVVMHGWQSEPTWWTERWLWLCVCPSLSLSFYNSLRHPLCVSLCLSLWLSIYLSIILSVA